MEILNNRLDVLEQEAENMKKMLLVSMNERRKTITEILQLFQTLCRHLYHSEAKHPLSFHKQETRHQNIGLLQVLCEDSNPFLVLRNSTKTSSLS
uniref:Uncharacterized protein n=1 Tax=Chenopodium quinoa TaxID=63459 RepID=A0A803M856_CHEQI